MISSSMGEHANAGDLKLLEFSQDSPQAVPVAVGQQPDVMKELSDILLLLAQSGETDLMSAAEMCGVD